MATKRIAASGGDYTTLSAWYASLPGTLTEPEIAELESFDLVEQLTFSAKNTTAANYIEIRAATGHGHNGVVGAGARVRCGSSPTLPTIYMTATHFRFTGIEIVMDKSGGTQEAFVLINAASESDVQVTGCIIRSVCTDTGVPAVNLSAGVSKFRNNIVISPCRSIDTRAATSCELSNNVFWRTADAIGCLANNNTTTRNCYSGASTGSSECFYTATGGVGSYNASSDTTAGTLYATGSIDSVAGTTAFTAPGSNDFSLATSSPLIDAGTTIAAVTTDIAGTSRPQNSVYDIGAFEKAAGGGGTLTVADAAHAQAADALVLVADTPLALADSAHAHTADALTLSSELALALADALHAHTTDNTVLTVPAASISYVGSAIGVSSIASMPAHQAGDLIIAWAFRDGSSTVPSLPTGWSNIGAAGYASPVMAYRAAYIVAVDGATTSGTWTGATNLIVSVYRGCSAASPIGVNAGTGGTGTTVSFPALSSMVTDGASWVVGMAGHVNTDGNLSTPPTGMVVRRWAYNTGVSQAALHDTNGSVSSWSLQTVAVGGTSGGWRGHTIELRPAAAENTSLTVADATHTHMADAIALSAVLSLLVNDAINAQIADNLTLTVVGEPELSIASADHTQEVDAAALSAAMALLVDDAPHGHASDVVESATGLALAVVDAFQAHAADGLALDTAIALAVDEALHDHSADAAALSAALSLIAQDAIHAHLADQAVMASPLPMAKLLRDAVFVRLAQQFAVVRVAEDTAVVRVPEDAAFVRH